MAGLRAAVWMLALASCVPAELYLSDSEGGVDATHPDHHESIDSARDQDRRKDRTLTDKDAPRDAGPGQPCSTAPDCPLNQACDPTSHTCSPACAGGLSCNGGCCDGVMCQAGDRAPACGTTGQACVSCAGDTPTCVGGVCEGSPCAISCEAGTCCGAGACVTGTAPSACGSGDSCMNCAGSPEGSLCVAGACGCNSQTDCPPFHDCVGGKCTTTSCGAYNPCHGGCCTGGNCVTGTDAGACGNAGGACSTCNSNNPICLPSGTCGCNTTTDCPTYQACKGGQCGQNCDVDAGAPCNGGCCQPTVMRCDQGFDHHHCGSGTGVCVDCESVCPGLQCLMMGTASVCGCQSDVDCQGCSAGSTCNLATAKCE